jgi:hypothetical protein
MEEKKAVEEEKPIAWVPVMGVFDIEEGQIVFPGGSGLVPPPNAPVGTAKVEQAVFGLALSSKTLGDGDLSADVEFEDVTEESICELSVSYDAGGQHLVNAGLGGDIPSLFAIREFGVPKPQEWDYRHVGGNRASLRKQKSYRLEARFVGAIVTLRIDGVQVASAQVASPLGRPRQVGVFCKGRHRITIKNFSVNARKPKAFVVMQFGAQYDDVYRDVVRGVCERYEVNALRGDDVAGPGLIIADIIREIASSQLIIADITPNNPNVYFEVGYALALQKPTILLARKGTPLPFDVAGFRVLFYEDSIGGKGKLEEGLRRHLAAILNL